MTRCEGWRRHGGAFTFGPVKWVQCTKKATVTLKVKQEGKAEKMPACMVCWKEAADHKNIKVLSATPLKGAEKR